MYLLCEAQSSAASDDFAKVIKVTNHPEQCDMMNLLDTFRVLLSWFAVSESFILVLHHLAWWARFLKTWVKISWIIWLLYWDQLHLHFSHNSYLQLLPQRYDPLWTQIRLHCIFICVVFKSHIVMKWCITKAGTYHSLNCFDRKRIPKYCKSFDLPEYLYDIEIFETI